MTNPIRVALESTLAAYAAAHSPVLPVAYEGVPFTKPAASPYLECYLFNSTTLDITTDGTRQRLLGLFAVNVYVKDGKGSKEGEDIVRGIIDAFPIIPQNFTLAIVQTPNCGTAIVDSNGWRCLPVSIRWRYESE